VRRDVELRFLLPRGLDLYETASREQRGELLGCLRDHLPCETGHRDKILQQVIAERNPATARNRTFVHLFFGPAMSRSGFAMIGREPRAGAALIGERPIPRSTNRKSSQGPGRPRA